MTDIEIIKSLDKRFIIKADDNTPIIDLSDLSILPSNIINQLCFELINKGSLEEYDYDVTDGYSDCGYSSDSNDNILLKSAKVYDIVLSFTAIFNLSAGSYTPYYPATYYTPEEPAEIEVIDEISIEDLKLDDGGDNELEINDDKIVKLLTYNLDGSFIEERHTDKFRENYFDQDDDYDDYDR